LMRTPRPTVLGVAGLVYGTLGLVFARLIHRQER
jgi:hypothetical protein